MGLCSVLQTEKLINIARHTLAKQPTRLQGMTRNNERFKMSFQRDATPQKGGLIG